MPTDRDANLEVGADTGAISDDEAARLRAEFLNALCPHGAACFDRLYECVLPLVLRCRQSYLRYVHLAENVANPVFVRLPETDRWSSWASAHDRNKQPLPPVAQARPTHYLRGTTLRHNMGRRQSSCQNGR